MAGSKHDRKWMCVRGEPRYRAAEVAEGTGVVFLPKRDVFFHPAKRRIAKVLKLMDTWISQRMMALEPQRWTKGQLRCGR